MAARPTSPLVQVSLLLQCGQRRVLCTQVLRTRPSSTTAPARRPARICNGSLFFLVLLLVLHSSQQPEQLSNQKETS